MIHPNTVIRFISDLVGVGVVATRLIPAGTITWVRDHLDRTFTADEIAAMSPMHQKQLDMYSFRDQSGTFILCWDHCKYMNHSFVPNCIATPLGLEIAVRDIEPGEELTNDYGFLNITESFTPVDEGAVRKTVYPDDLLHYAAEWDGQLQAAIPHLPNVDQPLRPIVPAEIWSELQMTALGERPLRSIAELYCG